MHFGRQEVKDKYGNKRGKSNIIWGYDYMTGKQEILLQMIRNNLN